MAMTYREFLRVRTSALAYVRLELAFVRLCGGDPAAAVLLSHIVDVSVVYADTPLLWPLPWGEVAGATGMPEKRLRTALRKLQRLGFVAAKVQCLPGTTRRMQHVRVMEGALMRAWWAATSPEQSPKPGVCSGASNVA